MRKIKIFDTTLRDGEQAPGCTMNLDEKLEIAAELDKLGVDIIEAGFAICSDDDFNAIKEVSRVVENAKLASLARCSKKDIDRAVKREKTYPFYWHWRFRNVPVGANTAQNGLLHYRFR